MTTTGEEPAPIKVFISFASEDDALREELVKHFAQLERDGLIESWHGRQIGAGEDWAGQIDEKLEAADIVLLLVSPAFLHSRYCYDIEMKRALERHAAGQARVIPVILRPSDWETAPFGKLQAFPRYARPVAAWPSRDEALLDVTRGLRRTVQEIRASGSGEGRPAPVAPTEQGTPSPSVPTAQAAPAPRAKLRYALVFILAPSVLAVGAVGVLMSWRVPTQVRLSLVVDRLAFTVAGAEPVDLPERPLNVRTLSVEDFDQVKFEPQRLLLTDRSSGQPDRIALAGPVTLNGIAGERSVLTMAPAGQGKNRAGRLEPITVNPGSKVILETDTADSRSLTLRVYGQELHSSVLPAGELELSITGASLTRGPATTSGARPFVLRATMSPKAPQIEFVGARPSFVVSATLDDLGAELLAKRIAITEVDFLKQGAGGAVESAVVAAGRIEYPDDPTLDPILLAAGDFVGIGELQDASLRGLTLREKGGIELGLEGLAGRLETVIGGAKRDRRLTALDRLWRGARTTVLFAVLAWALSVSIGAYRLYREITSDR